MRIRPVVSHVRGWFTAAAVTLVTAGLIVGEVNDTGFRRWWAGHPLTTDTVAGLLEELIVIGAHDASTVHTGADPAQDPAGT
jgi:hypothetical protein